MFINSNVLYTCAVGFFVSNNTCLPCPLGTYAASQNGGGVSMALACQVDDYFVIN